MAQKIAPTWVSLRVAHERTGVSVSALRKWYRNNTIRSETTDGPNGTMRLVALEDVIERAERFQAVTGARELTAAEAKLPEEVVAGRGVLVPRDAWERMMDGLSALVQRDDHLNEVTREAAVATTTAEFLREQVRAKQAEIDELRSKLEQIQSQVASAPVKRRRFA